MNLLETPLIQNGGTIHRIIGRSGVQRREERKTFIRRDIRRNCTVGAARVKTAGALATLVAAAAAADGDVAQGATARPVSAASLAEVAGLREGIIVEVAEFCVG